MKYTVKALDIAHYYHDAEGLSHAIRVANLSMRKLGAELDADRLYATALLHDILEDTNIDSCELKDRIDNEEIYNDIVSLTRERGVQYNSYIKRIAIYGSNYAIRVKQADIKNHLEQKETLSDSLKERYLKALPILI